AMAVAGPDFRRVGLDVTERFRCPSQQIGGDLWVGRFVPLAVRLSAHEQLDSAISRETNFRAFVRRTARGFEKTTKTETAQQASLFRSGAAKPARSASITTSSMFAAKRPQSTTEPSALV